MTETRTASIHTIAPGIPGVLVAIPDETAGPDACIAWYVNDAYGARWKGVSFRLNEVSTFADFFSALNRWQGCARSALESDYGRPLQHD